ncbi:histidinol-phosphatase [bacterium]|nr:histidinol-phosphatase [bacterium]NUN45307.1 histidinol-phosphatase [bacterium]
MSSEIRELLQAATHAAYEAGKLTLRYYQTASLDVIAKPDASPVTIADRSAEEWLRAFISKEFPDHGILGEEFGETIGSGRYRWILDPIDGTKSFIHGVPFYGTMVAIEDVQKKDAIVGVIHFPALGEILSAATNEGATINGRRVKARTTEYLAEATLLTTDMKSSHQGDYAPILQTLIKETKIVRTWGDCYGHALVACGRADIMVDPKLNLWDIAALKPIIEESGAVIFDRNGVTSMYIDNAIACGPALQKEIWTKLNISHA